MKEDEMRFGIGILIVGMIVTTVMFSLGIWIGKGMKKGWEHLDPKDRFVPYYVQKSQGMRFVVVRDDVIGKEYLIVKTRKGISVVGIDKGVKK